MSRKDPKGAGYINLPIMPPAMDRANPMRRIQLPPKPISGSGVTPSPLSTDENGSEASSTERERLVEAMERAGWVQAKAARILGLTPRQMGYALRKHSISIKRF